MVNNYTVISIKLSHLKYSIHILLLIHIAYFINFNLIDSNN